MVEKNAGDSGEDAGIESLLREMSGNLAEVLRGQKDLVERLGDLERRMGQVEEGSGAVPSPPQRQSHTYDYRVLLNSRTYTIEDVKGRRAEMVSIRRCLALVDLPKIRTRYHTGSGDRKVRYDFRLIEEGRQDEPDWTQLEYQIDKGAGADFSAYLSLDEPVRGGDVFEVRHRLELLDSFTGRNEWVTLVVEYPTERFHLEVVLPPGRKVIGARREESEGASNSFNKRRVFPGTIGDVGQVLLEWDEEKPVTGRAYTMFWDW